MKPKLVVYSDWTPFAWQGIYLKVPTDWNPGKIVGDSKSGSVRLDDPQSVRLELEWKESSEVNQVTHLVDRYVEGLAKNAQKQKHSLNVQRRAHCPGLNLPNMQYVEYFIWTSNLQVHTLVCYSPITNRLLFLRVMGYPNENLEKILAPLFNSLKDHSHDTPQTWALYDLICNSPPNYALETSELKSGHLRLRFQLGSNIVQIDRISLAEILLKKRSLDDWFLDFFKKEIRHILFDIEETKLQEHIGLRVWGRPKSRWYSLLQPLPFWNIRPRLHLEGRVWTCPNSNKIYSVQTFWKKPENAPNIDACWRGVICHQESLEPIRKPGK